MINVESKTIERAKRAVLDYFIFCLVLVAINLDQVDASPLEGLGQKIQYANNSADFDRSYNQYHTARGGSRCSACMFFRSGHLFFPPSKFKNVLDVGAGNCAFMKMLQGTGFSVKGVEYSKTPVKLFCEPYFKAKYYSSDKEVHAHDDSIQIYNMELTKLPFPDNNFDLVTSFEVLEHVPEEQIEQILSEIVRVSRGVFVGSFPACRAGADPDKPAPAHLHITLHGRQWWDDKFSRLGCKPELEMAKKLYRRYGGKNVEIIKKLKKNYKRKIQDRQKRRCEYDFNKALGFHFDELHGTYVFNCPKKANGF